MGTLVLLAFLAAAAAAAGASSSSTRRSSTPATGGSPAIAPPPSGTSSSSSSPSSSSPSRSSTSSSSATPAPQPSAWARSRGATSSTSSSAPSRSTSSRGRSDGGVAIESATPDQAARLVASAVHSGSSGMSNAQRLAGRWLDVASRNGSEVGRFVAQLQAQHEDAIAEWSLDRWRSPAGTPTPSAPSSATRTPSGDPAAGITAASHALHLVQTGAADMARSYLAEWVRDPHRTTIEVSRAARDLQAGGQDGLADDLLDDWNEHEHTSAVA